MEIKRLYTFFQLSLQKRHISDLQARTCAIDMVGWIYQDYFLQLQYCGINTS